MDTASVASFSSSKGPDDQLIIVLHVEEGIHLNAADAILIQSSLSGNKLEAEPVKPGHTTLFDCNLIWETNRKSIKQMKTENLPVKIDCYDLKNFKGNVESAQREHIGYIIVPVKTIPIVSLAKALATKPRWSKLIGLSKDWRPHRPELLMNIMITTKDYLTCNKNEVLDSKGLESGESVVIEENPVPCMLTSQRGIFIRLLQQEGLLQVGNIDTNCDIFTVKILLKNIRFLENVVAGADGDFFISYSLLGNSHIRPLDKKFNRIYQVHEKLSINFRSSLASLKQYFEEVFFVPFEVLSGSESLGSSELKISQLITTTDLQEFMEKNPSQFYEIEGISNIKATKEQQPNTNRPILEYKVMIYYVTTKKLHQTELLENYKRQNEIDSQAGGDHGESVVQLPLEPMSVKSAKRSQLSDIPEVRSESESSNRIKSSETPKQRPVTAIHVPRASFSQSDIETILNKQQEKVSSQLPRLFSYNLQLTSFKFNRKPEKGIWQISFYHDKADLNRVHVNTQVNEVDDLKDNTLAFEDLELKLYFTSNADDILQLIKSSELCTLCVKGPRGTSAKAQLDCESLLIGSKEKMSGIILLQNEIDNVTIMAKIYVYLEELGVNFNAPFKTSIQLEPFTRESEMNVTRTHNDHLFDENLTYKVIEELDEWKKIQQDSFLEDLKMKEKTFLEKLRSSWIQKQATYEQDLVSKAENLKQLTKSLSDAQKSLNNKKTGEELDCEKVKLKLESAYNDQLLGIRERARRVEEDLLHEMKLREIRFEDAERCNQHQEKENCELRQKVQCLQAELRTLRDNLVPKEEVERMLQEMRLLKEKCESVQQSKLFYKEEWAKATRECHILRREKIEDVGNEIFSVKCDQICNALEDYHFKIDDNELEELKRICLSSPDDDGF